MEDVAGGKFRAVLIVETDQFLVIEASVFLREDLWVPCRHVADCKTALLATLINKTPALFVLLHPNLFHFRVTTCAWYER